LRGIKRLARRVPAGTPPAACGPSINTRIFSQEMQEQTQGDSPTGLLQQPSELLQQPAELLQQLIEACNEGTEGAMDLARRTEIEPLRAFLQESARQYRRAADEIRTVWKTDEPLRRSHHRSPSFASPMNDGDDPVATWERAECEALTYFRDAYDGPLPDGVAETVKRHFEAGVERLERLRALQSRRA
jgi:hypothetical protein